jgi:hypothetical protein
VSQQVTVIPLLLNSKPFSSSSLYRLPHCTGTAMYIYYVHVHVLCICIWIYSFVLWTNHLHLNYLLWENSLWYTSVLDYKHVCRTDYARNTRF